MVIMTAGPMHIGYTDWSQLPGGCGSVLPRGAGAVCPEGTVASAGVFHDGNGPGRYGVSDGSDDDEDENGEGEREGDGDGEGDGRLLGGGDLVAGHEISGRIIDEGDFSGTAVVVNTGLPIAGAGLEVDLSGGVIVTEGIDRLHPPAAAAAAPTQLSLPDYFSAAPPVPAPLIGLDFGFGLGLAPTTHRLEFQHAHHHGFYCQFQQQELPQPQPHPQQQEQLQLELPLQFQPQPPHFDHPHLLHHPEQQQQQQQQPIQQYQQEQQQQEQHYHHIHNSYLEQEHLQEHLQDQEQQQGQLQSSYAPAPFFNQSIATTSSSFLVPREDANDSSFLLQAYQFYPQPPLQLQQSATNVSTVQSLQHESLSISTPASPPLTASPEPRDCCLDASQPHIKTELATSNTADITAVETTTTIITPDTTPPTQATKKRKRCSVRATRRRTLPKLSPSPQPMTPATPATGRGLGRPIRPITSAAATPSATTQPVPSPRPKPKRRGRKRIDVLEGPVQQSGELVEKQDGEPASKRPRGRPRLTERVDEASAYEVSLSLSSRQRILRISHLYLSLTSATQLQISSCHIEIRLLTYTTMTQRRRTQIRVAQRAYRDRKDQAIVRLEGEVERFKKDKDDVIRGLSDFVEFMHSNSMVRHGGPDFRRRFKDISERILRYSLDEEVIPRQDADAPNDAGGYPANMGEGIGPTSNKFSRTPTDAHASLPTKNEPRGESRPDLVSDNAKHPDVHTSWLEEPVSYEIIAHPSRENASFPEFVQSPEGWVKPNRRRPKPQGSSGSALPPGSSTPSGRRRKLPNGKRSRPLDTVEQPGTFVPPGPPGPQEISESLLAPPADRFAASLGFSILNTTKDSIAHRMRERLQSMSEEGLQCMESSTTEPIVAWRASPEQHPTSMSLVGHSINNRGMDENSAASFQMTNQYTGPNDFHVRLAQRRQHEQGLPVSHERSGEDLLDSQGVEQYLLERGVSIPKHGDFVTVEIDPNDFNGSIHMRNPSSAGGAGEGRNTFGRRLSNPGPLETSHPNATRAAATVHPQSITPMFTDTTATGAADTSSYGANLCPAIPVSMWSSQNPGKARLSVNVNIFFQGE